MILTPGQYAPASKTPSAVPEMLTLLKTAAPVTVMPEKVGLGGIGEGAAAITMGRPVDESMLVLTPFAVKRVGV